MTRLGLIWRNIRYFRWANLAVVAGTAVATAVLAGALMVGDSVRGSLRDLAVQRLGRVDYALVATRFFPESLATRISQAVDNQNFALAPAIIVRGGASNEQRTQRTSGVQIAAAGGGFVPVERGDVIVNGEVADAVGASQPGASVLFTLPTAQETPRDATLAHRARSEVIANLPAKVSRVERQPGMLSLFRLDSSQRVPRNAWVELGDLQDAVEQQGRVNAILVTDAPGHGNRGNAVDQLNRTLKQAATLDDYGLELTRGPQSAEAALGSRTTYIDPPVLAAAQEAARAMNLPLRQVSVYLLNEVAKAGNEAKGIHYAVAAGIDPGPDGAPLADDEVVLNQWTADQLGAEAGDALQLKYYQRKPGGSLEVVSSAAAGMTLRVKRVLPMQGLGADRSLTPEYKGLTDARSISDWNPPEGVEIDKKLVTKADEAYWDQYRAAPKLFVSLNTAKKLWGGAYGDVTSVRVPADQSEAFAKELLNRLDPAATGLVFQPIKAQQIEAASGGTDFAGLFIGFSFFLIFAAALLVAMLFRLNIEQRARQLGLLSAVGFAPKALRRVALAEGMLLALAGAVIGLFGAVGYTWLMMAGLRTWWFGAVGTTALRLHVQPMTLAIGLVASLAVAFLAMVWGVWRVGRTPSARLLAGAWNDPSQARAKRARLVTLIGTLCAAGGLAMLALGLFGLLNNQAAFLGGGTLLLVASLCWAAGWLRPRPRTESSPAAVSSVGRLGARNAARHTARSVLAVGLIAFAAFTLVTVASMKQGAPRDTHERQSGAGGFPLILQADIPLLGDLNTPDGRRMLGILNPPPDADLWRRAQFTSMRSWAGQDVSCLNLTKPTSPTILAVPEAMGRQGRFKFARTLRDTKNPWELLNLDAGDPNVVPVIADNETAQYILHLGVGDTMPLTDQRGVTRQLKLVATLEHSIFQSELLMGEANFLRLFPAQSGFGVVLIDAPAQDLSGLRQSLSSNLDEYAVTVDPTAERLAAYAQVANTYLSTFQTLGSLGLMLGTIGLAVVLLRNLVERRAELALLAALGFRRADRLRLVLAENAFLLVLGLAVGTVCALLGIAPTLATAARTMNLPGLALTLLAVLLIGLVGLIVAVWLGQRHVTPADLRAE
jgi:putative ABC transport system permease protein